ncbi:hypothetical protein BP6252_08202 [Coleophoma cylindrospora]|uniref:Vacuolar membrane PQ loop repeat protein n=1 Tax=Coleophoma cylindrospora TaxID=1849047 RepID=A0A3D8RC62_9HELO|nr:hypothetical protein BP6252_08202 [Coleophoma cylindrospora]
MPTINVNHLEALSQTIPLREGLSGIFGSISMAAWMFLLVPQLVLNYQKKSAEGISLSFFAIWMIGDVTNLCGAVWANLLPTAVALPVYFCIADVFLISQCLYYNYLNAHKRQEHVPSLETEEEPLLTRLQNNDTSGLSGPHKRRLSIQSSSRHSLVEILDGDDLQLTTQSLRNILSMLAVIVLGTAGWTIAWKSGVWVPTPEDVDITEPNKVALGAQVLGYISALCYLGARIPQIVKNYKYKSTEGLSLLFFMLAMTGNLTYATSIFTHSIKKDYLYTNLPWLMGSLGTIMEDITIFIQFRIYTHPTSLNV